MTTAPIASSTVRSAELMARAERMFPGGVNSPVRAFRSVGGAPRVIERASGARVWDVDGNALIDYVGSWGPMILGHAHPAVVSAIARAAARGSSYGAPNPHEVALGERIQAAMPSIERLRFTSSGTEAAMSAIRLARAATGRNAIVKMAGGYHGHADALLVAAGSGAIGMPASAGVTAGAARDTLVVPYNDLAAVTRVLETHRVAAVLVEPVAANMGVVPPAPGYLAGLRAATQRRGALLVFDEVITGFRVARGGVEEREGVTPDLTILGKVIGGGLPAAAYAGPRELMERIAPAGDVYQAGTLSGNPLATAAGLSTLALLDEAAYARLDATTGRLAAGLRAGAAEAGVPVRVSHTTGLLTVFFSEDPVRDYDDARACDTGRYAAFCRAMLERGVYLPPSQFEAWFPSLAHAGAHVERTLEAAAEVFGAL